MTINIFQVPPDANFDFCGCGNGTTGNGGSGSGGNGGQLPPGGTPGDVTYNGQARVIDICANVETIFQDSIASWINTVQNLGYVPGGAESIFPTDISNFVFDSIGELEDELYGPEYTLALKRWIVRRFDDPFPGFGTGFDGIVNLAVARADLIATMPRWPPLVAGAPFVNALTAWSYTADIQALNKRIADSAGTASYSGECAALQEEAGREPYRPPASSQGVIVLEGETYKYTRVFAGEYGVNGDFNGAYSGTNYAGQLSKLTTIHTEDTGVGTALNQTIETTNQQGTVTETGGIGTGSGGTTRYQAGGEDDIGLTAAAAFPAYFSGWTDGNPQEPSGATYPEAGTFTGTIDLSSGQNTSAEYELWIVTGLDGEAAPA